MSLALISNPRGGRRSHRRRSHRKHFKRFYHNPRGMKGGMGSITGIILPVGLGVASGLAIPKFFPIQNKMTQYIIQGAVGLGIPLILGSVIGRKSSVLFGAGVLSAIVIGLVDDLVLKTQGKQVLSDTGDEVRVLTADPDVSGETFTSDAEDAGMESEQFRDTEDEVSDEIP